MSTAMTELKRRSTALPTSSREAALAASIRETLTAKSNAALQSHRDAVQAGRDAANLARSRWATVKLNSRQKLLTAAQLRELPPLYAQDGKRMNATAHVKFFGGAFTWFVTEFNPLTGEFFGLVYNENMADQMPNGELGYFTADDLIASSVLVRARIVGSDGRRSFRLSLERDLHFTAKTLREAVADLKAGR